MPEGSCSVRGDLGLQTHFHEAGSEWCQCGEVATPWPVCGIGDGAGWTWSMPADPVPVDRSFEGTITCTEITRAAPPSAEICQTAVPPLRPPAMPSLQNMVRQHGSQPRDHAVLRRAVRLPGRG